MAQWNAQANDIFARAAEVNSPSERQLFLDQQCGHDSALRAQVDSLIEASAKAGSFLNQPAGQANDAVSITYDCGPISEGPGTVIGPYKLMEQIGEGGMGLVFVAEQQHPVRRKVALKLIKPGMDTRQVVARFEAERQALALMEHPHIAKVLDAGATASGRPYFVMELVRGLPINTYCDAHNLSPQQRLKLFIQVCQAVQHAHQKGVIHRDLKPANVLVAPHDGQPVVKVIDFGVAKAVGQSLTDKTIYSRFMQMIGTPLYMSPEQAELNQLDVDTRSDVYSLGVLLYELLTGTTPFDGQRFSRAAFDEIRRIIREEEPPTPSTRLTTLGATLKSVSAHRGTDPEKLSKLIRGELDWIAMRCLEKDRTRRYDTVAGLSKDIQRFLADEPVEARPVSTWYRIQKAYRRNRTALSVVAGFAILLFAGMISVTWLWRAERSARADAEAARRDAEAKARELLDGAERMNAANVAIDMAWQNILLGQWAEAEAAHNRAIELRPDYYWAWLQRGELYAQMGMWDLALQDYKRSFALRSPETPKIWLKYELLYVLTGDKDGCRRVAKQMVERFGKTDDFYTLNYLYRVDALLPGEKLPFDSKAGNSEIVNLTLGIHWIAYYCRGLAHYNDGSYADAVRDLRNALSRDNNVARPIIYPILALALLRLGDMDSARKELVNARREYERGIQYANNSRDRFVPWQYWHDWPEFLIHYREAHVMIEGAEPPDDPRLNEIRNRALTALGHK